MPKTFGITDIYTSLDEDRKYQNAYYTNIEDVTKYFKVVYVLEYYEDDDLHTFHKEFSSKEEMESFLNENKPHFNSWQDYELYKLKSTKELEDEKQEEMIDMRRGLDSKLKIKIKEKIAEIKSSRNENELKKKLEDYGFEFEDDCKTKLINDTSHGLGIYFKIALSYNHVEVNAEFKDSDDKYRPQGESSCIRIYYDENAFDKIVELFEGTVESCDNINS